MVRRSRTQTRWHSKQPFSNTRCCTLSLSLSMTSRPYRRYRMSRHSSSSMLPPPSLSQICRRRRRRRRRGAGQPGEGQLGRCEGEGAAAPRVGGDGGGRRRRRQAGSALRDVCGTCALPLGPPGNAPRRAEISRAASSPRRARRRCRGAAGQGRRSHWHPTMAAARPHREGRRLRTGAGAALRVGDGAAAVPGRAPGRRESAQEGGLWSPAVTRAQYRRRTAEKVGIRARGIQMKFGFRAECRTALPLSGTSYS